MPDPSPDTEIQQDAQVTTEASAVTTDAQTPAESSTAEVKDDKGDMLAAVKAALKPQTESPSGSDEPGSKSDDATAKPEAKKEGTEGEAEPDALTEEETAQLRPKTRKRIENLVRDRKERDDKIATLEPKVQQLDAIVSFVDEAGLTKDEVNQGFAVMRDLKQEPYKAYQRLKPIMAQLATMFGEGDLPADLAHEVATGQITEQRARDLVNARSLSSLAETRNADTVRQTHEQTRRANVDDAAGAVTEWENSKAKTDPDWKVKQPRVMELVELEVVRRQRKDPSYFPTKAEALDLAAKSLDKVEKEMKAFSPKPRAINPVTDAGSTRSVAKPTNAVEAAKLALAQAG